MRREKYLTQCNRPVLFRGVRRSIGAARDGNRIVEPHENTKSSGGKISPTTGRLGGMDVLFPSYTGEGKGGERGKVGIRQEGKKEDGKGEGNLLSEKSRLFVSTVEKEKSQRSSFAMAKCKSRNFNQRGTAEESSVSFSRKSNRNPSQTGVNRENSTLRSRKQSTA